MKAIAWTVALLATTGCASALRGPDTCTEIHFDTTYVLARWAGWPADDALRIAAADVWTDQHAETNSVATERRILGGIVNPLTIPRVLIAGTCDIVMDGEAPPRAFGRRAAEATAWAAPSLGHRLHFPARDLHTRVTPAFVVNPSDGEIEYGNAEARRVLERAFLDLLSRDEDRAATLAMLGVALHTVQDSIKHCGFDAAFGHIGAKPDPDEPCGDPATTLASAEVTLSCLRYARRLSAGCSSAPPPGWKDRLGDLYASADPEERRRAFARLHAGDEYPGRAALLKEWQAEGGEAAFDRALDRIRETLR